MIDRRKVAPILLVLGAGLAAVGSFQYTYRTLYPGFNGPDQVLTTTLWTVTSEPAEMPRDAYSAAGWPVILAALAMVVAAVLVLRERTSFAGRPAAMGAAGALAGIVALYVVQVLHEKEVMASWPSQPGQLPWLSFLPGTYVLVAAAVIGLVGAVLAQRKQEVQPAEEEDEDAVVVHQLDNNDDTPPFGLAVLSEEQQQETR